MRTIRWMAVAVTAVIATACDLTVPDFNNADLNDLQNNPTPSKIASATTGLLVAMRDEYDDRNGYVSLLGILGRESYNFDGADPRFITEMLEGPLDPASPAFGANLWTERYRNVRQGDIILRALDAISDGDMPPQDKEAVRGFVKTMVAHELLLVVNTRDLNGAVVQLKEDPLDPPAPLVTRDVALQAVADLLDEAAVDLGNAGAAFPFALSSGFVGFDAPAAFLPFNRALRARVAAYMGSLNVAGAALTWYQEALDALGESFLVVDAAQFNLGVYHVFTTGSGDNENELFDPGQTPDIVAHLSLDTLAEQTPGGQPDLRVQRKIRLVESQTSRGLTTDRAFSIYTSLSAPMPIIRNEELILLRAEAQLALNPTAALDDINFVRENSGGLAPIDPVTWAAMSSAQQLGELLRQRRYSLMFEGGHSWIDFRRYDRITDLPLDLDPGHGYNLQFPIPEAECLARGEATPCSV